MIPAISLSTCWCSHRHADGYDMLHEIRERGFEAAELSHVIGMLLVPGILKALQEGWIRISSVHNFCPLPSGISHAAPNLFQPSSPDRRELDLWLRYTSRTLEFAQRLEASAVVMHCGSVPFRFRSPERVLSAPPGPAETVQGGKRDKALARLRAKAKPFQEQLVASCLSLLEQTAGSGLRIGLENREGVLELPLDSEWTDFLQRLAEYENVGYWHDTGHAGIKERLGLLSHRQHLESLSEQLVGFHLHDVSEAGRDHQAPGTGLVDFKMVREFIRPHHLLVAELSPSLKREEVIDSHDYLRERLHA